MIKRIVDSIRSFFGSGIIVCFFGRKKYAFVAYGGLVVLMGLLSINVWGAMYWAKTLYVLGNMHQNTATYQEYARAVFQAFAIWFFVFFVTDNLTWRVKNWMAVYWRRQARFWYEEIAENNPRKITHVGQRVIDAPANIVEKLLDLVINGYRAIIALFVFVPMVISFSPHFETFLYAVTLQKFGFGLYIPWLLMWALILIFVLEMWVSSYFGRPLADLDAARQKTTALARTNADRSHKNNRSGQLFPAMRDDHLRKRTRLSIQLLFLRENKLIKKTFRLVYSKSAYNVLWATVPLLLIGYFVAVLISISLGVMNQSIAAMNEVHKSLAVIPDSWQAITEIRASMKLLREIETDPSNPPTPH